MADAAVESPLNVVPPHLKPSSTMLTNLDSGDALGGEGIDEYSTYKKLQQELEYINLQEEYIKDEQRFEPPVSTIQLSLIGLKESQERTGARTGRDQADTKCSSRDWTVYGSDRSEVRFSNCYPCYHRLMILQALE